MTQSLLKKIKTLYITLIDLYDPTHFLLWVWPGPGQWVIGLTANPVKLYRIALGSMHNRSDRQLNSVRPLSRGPISSTSLISLFFETQSSIFHWYYCHHHHYHHLRRHYSTPTTIVTASDTTIIVVAPTPLPLSLPLFYSKAR